MEASKTRRLINWLIDDVVILLALAMVVRLISDAEATQWQLRLASLGALFLYYVSGEFFFQRSLGKLLTRTIVVNKRDERPSLTAIVLRTVCRFIPLEPLSMLLNTKYAWHDRLSGTKVVFINY
ncbi:RDD family protein [Hymenobacter wooponensis]|uniref:RDD domain-containing protein n=1 Tax=Hymenobacter wooponensis TaxID=1525360 RepID=A0A4Z0MHS0_9BACT|nr:hypothetical protein EU557_19070 [Hymenobacter wooponensis]